MDSFDKYMKKAFPNYKNVLEIQEILYLKALFSTYQDSVFNDLSAKNKPINNIKKELAKNSLDRAITEFLKKQEKPKIKNN